MRYLMAILFSIIADTVSATEIIMACDRYYYKFEKSYFSTKIKLRHDGVWHSVCDGRHETLIIGEKGGKCETEGGVTLELRIGSRIRSVLSVEQTLILDFIKMERILRTSQHVDKTSCREIS